MDSLAVRIPKRIAEDLGLEANSGVEIQEREGSLVLTTVKRFACSLDELVAQINPENLHGETCTGQPAKPLYSFNIYKELVTSTYLHILT